jgi:hypothetical protein
VLDWGGPRTTNGKAVPAPSRFTMLVVKRGDELRIADHDWSSPVELNAQPAALRSSASGNGSRRSEWLLMGKLGVGLADCLWPVVMLPTNGGQSDQARVDSSKASGAT